MGQRLIAIGERMAEHPSPRSSLAKAA
jgi:hypothetical protein